MFVGVVDGESQPRDGKIREAVPIFAGGLRSSHEVIRTIGSYWSHAENLDRVIAYFYSAGMIHELSARSGEYDQERSREAVRLYCLAGKEGFVSWMIRKNEQRLLK